MATFKKSRRDALLISVLPGWLLAAGLNPAPVTHRIAIAAAPKAA
jgi:hypothetical protein